MRKHYTISMLFVLFLQALTAADDVYFSKIGIEDGLSQLTVMSIYQDELGTMWFGTREGVSRYDGNSMEIIRPVPNDSNSLHGSLIRYICGDKSGSVYIHSQGGVNRYDLRSSRLFNVQSANVDAIAYGASGLWLAEGNRLYLYKNNKKELYLALDPVDAHIRILRETSEKRLIIGTLASGVYIADPNKKVRKVIQNISQVSSIFEDSRQNIWIGSWYNGLFRIEKNGRVRNYLPDSSKPANSLSSTFVRAITQDNNDVLWIGTRKGLDKLFIDKQQFEHYDAGSERMQQLSNESVWSLYKDIQGTVWIGTYFGGVNYFNPEIDYFTFHDLRKGVFLNKAFPVISDIKEDGRGGLFLSTEGDGLIWYQPQKGTYANYRQSTTGLTVDNIKISYFDRKNDLLYLGTHLGGISVFSPSKGTFKRYPVINQGLEQSNIVRSILPYENQLIIGTYNGIYLFNPTSGTFRLLSEELNRKVAYVVDLKLDGDVLWIGGTGLWKYHLKTQDVRYYSHQPGSTNSLSNNSIMKLLLDSKNRLWIATNGGGVNLFDKNKETFRCFHSGNSSLRNDYISNLMESPYGYIFMTTTHGLTVLDTETGKATNYDTQNGFPLNSLYNGGMITTSNGQIFIAGMNGMVSFNEENLTIPNRPFTINLVKLILNNQEVKPNDESGVLESALPFTNSIVLNHRHTMVNIEFATNNYIAENQPFYRYRLKGFSDQWTQLPRGTHNLNFMGLRAGSYELVLEAFPANDPTAIATTSLKIKVLPPFYKAWYAYLVYVLLIAFIIWRYILFVRSKLLLKASLEYEKREKEHIEEVNQSKLRFFTNISHEFRTPLTLISGQVDMLLQIQGIQPAVYNRILNIKRNSLNMQNLITELLEFRKSEQGHLQLKVSERDFMAFLYEIYLSFTEYAAYRSIRFDFAGQEEKIMLWFDASQLQKVFYNLISNAFKYTPKDGAITIRITELADEVQVEVIDTGSGIEASAIDKIFDRFYQAENGLASNALSPGTGIGLALSKNILEVHHATITVSSKLNEGTVFQVRLKKGSTHFSDSEKVIVDNSPDELTLNYFEQPDQAFIDEMKETQLINRESKPRILIVEDNEELRKMLEQLFEPVYEVYTAADGEEGLEKTLEHEPDLVLSDLMMPRMSGSELCSRIKNNFQVSHIPVVLLTAQTAVEYTIEGLRLGADDYITKPFNVKTLITRCNNLINNRKILQEKFSKQTDFSPRLLATNQLDREFLEKAQQVIEAHLDDSEFDVLEFSREMALGRTKLFSKIKGITGKTPNDFILNVRLKKAATYLSENPEYNVSEITYMLGFSSPKYFAKCFKEHFGMSPTEYRNSV